MRRRAEALRDRALLGSLGLQALRTVEIAGANVADLQQLGDNWALLVHGNYQDRDVFVRPDVAVHPSRNQHAATVGRRCPVNRGARI
jgi:hypothetical protein